MSSFGETLKRERESRQISLREISEATKVNLRYLEALERNEFRHLPGGVFNKGFVRAYSQHVGIDADRMVAAYLQELQEQEQRAQERSRDSQRKPTGRVAPAGGPAPSAGARSPRSGWQGWTWVLVAVILIALGILAGFVLVRVWPQAIRPAPPAEAAPEGSPQSDAPAEPQTGGAPGPPAGGASSTAAAGSTAGAASENRPIRAKIVIEKATAGRINCDDREVRSLASLPLGAVLDLRCAVFLSIDTDDAGAVRLGLDGALPTPLGADGAPLRDYRLVPAAAGRSEASETRP